jgi:hypothetical protein
MTYVFLKQLLYLPRPCILSKLFSIPSHYTPKSSGHRRSTDLGLQPVKFPDLWFQPVDHGFPDLRFRTVGFPDLRFWPVRFTDFRNFGLWYFRICGFTKFRFRPVWSTDFWNYDFGLSRNFGFVRFPDLRFLPVGFADLRNSNFGPSDSQILGFPISARRIFEILNTILRIRSTGLRIWLHSSEYGSQAFEYSRTPPNTSAGLRIRSS